MHRTHRTSLGLSSPSAAARSCCGRAVGLATLALLSAGCTRNVNIDLHAVEPCDQSGRALSGVSSFKMSSQGAPEDHAVVFSIDTGPAPLTLPLGDVSVSLEAFADDITGGGGAVAIPQAVGHTPPLGLAANTPNLKLDIIAGLFDSFGKTTDTSGACTTMTPDAPVKGRHGHTATWVPVLNKVLIFGGAVWVDNEQRFVGTAELYDPATGTFEALPDSQPRAYHAASAMPDGRVLITGGFGVISGTVTVLTSAVLFDPTALDQPYHTLNLRQRRAHHTSTLMDGAGLIAIAGGCADLDPAQGCTPDSAGASAQGDSTDLTVSIETFDITQASEGATTIPAAQGLTTARAFHAATVLGDAASAVLLISGGVHTEGTVCTVEAFRADSGVLSRVAGTNLLPFPAGKCPARHQAVALDGQRVLMIGGQTQAPGGRPQGPGTPDVFFFTTTAGVEQAASLQLFSGQGRAGHLATRMSDGSVLIVGGQVSAAGPTAEVMALEPGTGQFVARVLAGPPATARDWAAMAVMPMNQVLVTGGHSTTPPFSTTDATELYFTR